MSRIRFAAWCNACLRGSEVLTFRDAPLVGRFLAIERLRAEGWVHEVEPGERMMSKGARQDAERAWSGATYCLDCATNQRMRKSEGTHAHMRQLGHMQ